MKRIVSWFSCGANSAIATYLALKKYGKDRVEIVYCDTGGEHPDNMRFLLDCQQWYGKEITVLQSEYKDHFDVWERKKFIKNNFGAECTVALKKRLRFAFQQVDDIQVFGYSVDEKHRAERFNEAYPEVTTDFILIDAGLQKKDCIGLLSKQDIAMPEMYKLGFNNNNCIGCCKGGAGYWNHIRKHFPEQFERAAQIEKQVGHAICKVKGEPVYLHDLDPNAGNHKQENISCDFLCQSMELDNI